MTFLRRTGPPIIPGPDPIPLAPDLADRMENDMLQAIAHGDAALAAYRSTRNVNFLIDGLLDIRSRLTKGLPPL